MGMVRTRLAAVVMIACSVVVIVAGGDVAVDAAVLDPGCADRTLFVAGASPVPNGDRSFLDAVESRHPGSTCVATVADDDASVEMAEQYDVVVISSSVRPTVLGDRLAAAAVPILVAEPYLFDAMSLVAPRDRGELPGRTTLQITDPSHPLAAGLTGTVSVLTDPGNVNFGTPTAGGESVANTGGTSRRSTIFAFATGDEVANSTAPAGRVGFFPAYNSTLTPAGRQLTSAALDWLLEQPAQTPTCGAVIVTDITLDADLLGCPGHGLVVGADDITIDLGGHTLQGTAAAAGVAGFGVDLRGHRSVTIRNGHIDGFFYGVNLFMTDDDVVEDLSFSGSVHSVEMVAVRNTTLRRLTSYSAEGTAVRSTGGGGNEFTDVTTYTSRWGIILDDSNGNLVANSSFDGVGAGAWSGVSVLGTSGGNTVRNTTTQGWGQHGILVDEDAVDTTVDGNRANGNIVDGIRVEARTEGTVLVGNTANDNGEWGIRALGPVDDRGGNSASGNGIGACDGVACGSEPAQRGLLVAGSAIPPTGDRPIVSLIEDAGIALDIADDDALAGVDPAVYDIVFISTSVVPDKVGATFRDVPIPVVTWEGQLFDEMAMSDSGESSALETNIVLADPTHALAAGLDAGWTRVYTSPNRLSYGAPAADAEVVAFQPGHPNRAVIFAYDAGAKRTDGTPAPALRVGTFPSYDGAQVLTLAGRRLLSATIEWSVAGGPPVNDDFADRLPATVGTTTGDNRGATLEPGEPAFSPDIFIETGSSVWWTWTAPFDGVATIDTVGSTFDTHLAVWQGDAVDQLTFLRTNDDSEGFTSLLGVPVTAGQTYAISVSGIGEIGSGVFAEGDIDLTIARAQTPPNDAFADRTPFVGPTASGANTAATAEPGEPEPTDGAGQASVWFTWTATASGPVSFDTFGSGFDTLLAVWTGDDLTALVEVASNDDCCWSPSYNDTSSAVDFDAVAGTTYAIAVYGLYGETGRFTLNGPS